MCMLPGIPKIPARKTEPENDDLILVFLNAP